MVVKKSVLRLTIFGGRLFGRVYWILMVHCPESEILVGWNGWQIYPLDNGEEKVIPPQIALFQGD